MKARHDPHIMVAFEAQILEVVMRNDPDHGHRI
jgi:hypothetical protein